MLEPEIHEVSSEFNLEECDADKCVFIGKYKNNEVYLALFVDDGLVASNNVETFYLIIRRLSETFKITEEDSNVFVGLQIQRDRERKRLMIHQSAYTRKIIEKFGMADAKTVNMPADPHAALSPTEETDETKNNAPYREAVRSLVSLAAVSRPDIAHAVNSVSKYLSDHNATHWRVVKRIFTYLKGTSNYGIEYANSGSKAELIGFSDANYAGDIEARRSTTGYVFCLANGVVTRSSIVAAATARHVEHDGSRIRGCIDSSTRSCLDKKAVIGHRMSLQQRNNFIRR